MAVFDKIIVSIPHSGLNNIAEYIKVSKKDILINSDPYVNKLVSNIKSSKFYFIYNTYSKMLIDLNRNIRDIDESLISKDIKEIIDILPSVKSKNGIGLFHKIDQKNNPIQRQIIDKKKFMELKKIYDEFYLKIEKEIINSLHQEILFLDLHSMPHIVQNKEMPEIILSNINHETSEFSVLNQLTNIFQKSFFSVEQNYIFKGGNLNSF